MTPPDRSGVYELRIADITVCIVPRMAHMHNFAGTREVLWARLEHWTRGIAASSDES